MENGEFFKDSGRFRICWCGPENNRVYVAWVVSGKNYFGDNTYSRIGVFKTGSDDDRKAAARNACREYHKMKKAG